MRRYTVPSSLEDMFGRGMLKPQERRLILHIGKRFWRTEKSRGKLFVGKLQRFHD